MFIEWQGYTLNTDHIVFVCKKFPNMSTLQSEHSVFIQMVDNNIINVTGNEYDVDMELKKLNLLIVQSKETN